MAKGTFPRKRGLHAGISNGPYRLGHQICGLGLTGIRRAEPEYSGPAPEIEEREKANQQLQEWANEQNSHIQRRREESEKHRRGKTYKRPT